MDSEVPIHPFAGRVTNTYYTSEDGTVRVPAVFTGAPRDKEVSKQVIEEINKYKWRDGDFLLAAYPKCGERFTLEIYR